MDVDIRLLWRDTIIKLLISCGLFAILLAVLYAIEWFFPVYSGVLLHFHDVAFSIGIPASVIGVAYILSVKNPSNYTGFYLGAVSSFLLGVQFFLERFYDLTLLYFVVFIPFQMLSVLSWKKGKETRAKEFGPAFLSTTSMLLTLLFFCLIMLVNYGVATYLIYGDTLCDNIFKKMINGSMIAASILANFWLIYKKNDSWIYWLVYSVSGLVLSVFITHNIFSAVLFVFFLVVNSLATIAWIKGTPKENYGWLKK